MKFKNLLFITEKIQIPLNEFEFSFVRSSGPGGQNVNKVNSKAVLRWDFFGSASLSDSVRARFLNAFKNRLTIAGDVVISSDQFRDQQRNQEDCLEKLKQMLLSVAIPPKPRKKTKPSRTSQLKLKKSKSLHGKKKSLRKRPGRED